VDRDSKTVRRSDEKRIPSGPQRNRKSQPNGKVSLSPIDFLKLLPKPLVLSDRSLGAYARQLELRRLRLERLKASSAKRGFVVAPQRVHAPNLAKLQTLEKELEVFPTRRILLKRSEFRVYADALRRMRRTVSGLIRQVRECEHRSGQDRYLARIGRLFLDAPDEVLESFIVSRRNRSGKNLHAAALARIRAANLQPGQLSEWGRRGARVRLEKHRVAKIGGESTPSPTASSPNETQVSNAPE
jgi:hypothetical protein